MRLIDADSLIDLVTDSTILGDGFKTAFCALVNGEPTVKMQKTGHWDDSCYMQRCSVCGGRGKKSYKYCPYCGSRNRGEEE